MEERRIACCGGFPAPGIVDADDRVCGDQVEQRGRWSAKQQGAGARIEPFDMGAARGAQPAAQRLLFGCRLLVGHGVRFGSGFFGKGGDGPTMGRSPGKSSDASTSGGDHVPVPGPR
jgi:hypothetical protein